MKQAVAALCVLVCLAAVCSAQRCPNLPPLALHFGVCLNVGQLESGATGEMFDDIRESGVSITDITAEELDLPVRGCRGGRGTGQNLQLTLNIANFVLTGKISRKRLFKTRRGTFRATATNSVVTCTIQSEQCLRPENTQCTVRYGGYRVDFTGRLLGIIAKRRIASGIKARIPREITRLVIRLLTGLRERLGASTA